MNRTLTLAAPALILLSLAPDARAILVTGYAIGTVTNNFSEGPKAYPFAVGQPIYLRYQYDLDPSLPTPRVGVLILTDDGLHFEMGTEVGGGRMNFATVSGANLSLDAEKIDRNVTIRLVGDNGFMTGYREISTLASDGFRADIHRVSGPEDFPVPEPSTLVSGMIGAGLLGLAAWRRRR